MVSNKELLYNHVKFLTTLRPFRNCYNLESLEKVCCYLKGQLGEYGLNVREQVFEAKGEEYKNIVATYNSGKRRRLIVGAHYLERN